MREVPLYGFRARSEGLVALVDDADYGLVAGHRWYPQARPRSGEYSAMRHIVMPGKHATQFMHTLIMGAPLVDHADGNPLNNQRSNLRIATAGQNARNARKRRDARTSRFKGVHVQGASGRWIAQIQFNNRKKHLGYFDIEEAAARAYDAAARELFGEFAWLNFPGESD